MHLFQYKKRTLHFLYELAEARFSMKQRVEWSELFQLCVSSEVGCTFTIIQECLYPFLDVYALTFFELVCDGVKFSVIFK